MVRKARWLISGLLAGLTLATYAGPAQACSDGGCGMSWSLRNPHLTCAGRAVLAPGNDSRINLLFLMADRAGKGPVSAPGADMAGYGYGNSFFEWKMLRQAYTPARSGDDTASSSDGSRCDSLAGGGTAFKAALATSGIAAEEQQQLIAARERVQLACGGLSKHCLSGPQASPAPKGRLSSAISRPPSNSTQATGMHRAAALPPCVPRMSPWVAETATYMARAGRSQRRHCAGAG